MNPRTMTSREPSSGTTFLERAAERSGSGLLIAFGAMELGAAVTFIAGGTINRFHLLPFAAILLAMWLYRGGTAGEPDRRVGAASFAVSLLVVFASFGLAGSTLDLSADGQTAHMLRISHLANGWNPVYDVEFSDQPDDYILAGAPTRFVDSGLGPYVAAASVVALLGDIEYGKGFNLILMSAVGLLALAATLGANPHRGLATAVALIAALNPVSVVQSLTTYVDGQVGALIACLVFLTMILARRPAMWTTTAWVAAVALLVNVKVTGLAFAVIIGSGALAFLLWRGFSPRRGVASLCSGLALGIGVIGFHAYVLGFVRHGRILRFRDLDLSANLLLVVVAVAFTALGGAIYWLLRRRDARERFRSLTGPRAVALGLGAAIVVSLLLAGGLAGGVPSFMRVATVVNSDDAGLLVQPSGKVAQAVGSIFSESAVMPATHESDTTPTGYRIKIPFEVRSDELSSYRHLNPDHRVGGFGPWMSGAFLVGCSILLLMWFQSSESRSELGFWLVVILASVLLFPKPWWARFVPQVWLVPVLIAGYGCRSTNRRATRRLAQILLVIMGTNVGMVLYEHGRGQIALQSAAHRTMVALQGLPQPVPVYFSNFRSAVFRFREYGVEYTTTLASDCPRYYRYLKLLRSEVRVCTDSPEEPRWQQALAQARAIDADLTRAGVESFRVVPPEPRDRIALLEPDVHSLVEEGHFSAAEGRELLRILRRTGRLLERREDERAVESLRAFAERVLSLMDSGSIPTDAAMRLVDSTIASGLRLDNPIAGFPISIDVGDLSYRRFALRTVGSFDRSGGPVPLALPLGEHRLELLNGRSPAPWISFTVRVDGKIQFDPSLDPLVGGRGTTAMVLHGTRVEIDVGALGYDRFELDGADEINGATDPVPFVLMPGAHTLWLPGARSAAPRFDFVVQPDGKIQFDPSLDALVGGRGTGAMVLHGIPIEIDVGELSYTRFELTGFSQRLNSRLSDAETIGATDPGPFVVMPGGHGLSLLPDAHSAAPGFDFTVQPDGRIQFDPSLDPWVGGRGTGAMVLRGIPIEIDVSELSYNRFELGGLGQRLGSSLDEVEIVDATDAVPVVLMPGGHQLSLLPNSRREAPGFDFTVQPDGRIRFDPPLDSLVDGRGTRAMVLRGIPIGIDVSESSYERFELGGLWQRFDGSPDQVEFTRATDPVPFVLMPGGHGLSFLPDGGTAMPWFDFTVQGVGTLQFDRSLDELVSGRGTATLVVSATE